jgi:hypothetical protein
MGTQIRQIHEHPFQALNARLEDIDKLDEEGNADPEVISDLLDELLKEATIAYIKHETANVQRRMQPKGIKVLVSALAHTSSRSRIQKDGPILDDMTAGIYCPTAMAMKECYLRALDRTVVGSGPGVYNKQRNEVRNSNINPGTYRYGPPGEALRPLLKKIEEKIQTQQRESWKTGCESFVASIVEQVEGFSNAAEQLLMNSSYVTKEHKQARGELRTLLSDFDISLEDVQGRFVDSEEEHTEKKIKREEMENEVTVGTLPTTDLLTASVPILRNEGWTQFREVFGGIWPGH